MNKRHWLMVAGLVLGAWFALFGDKTPSGGIAQPVSRASAPWPATTPAASVAWPTAAGATRSQFGKAKQEPVILKLQSRETLIGGMSNDGKPADDLFASQSWAAPPPPPPKPTPPPAPRAPPLPFTFLGKKSENAAWEVYLARGDKTFIVRENAVIDDLYRVDSIKPPSLNLIYLPLNEMQLLTIGGAD